MNKTIAIILGLLIALLDLILETPEGLKLVGLDMGMEDGGHYKLLYYTISLLFHIGSCTLIVWLIFSTKPYYKSFFWLLLIGLAIITPLFYYFNVYLNEKGEDRILAISNVYYFLRSPIILIYTLPIFFLWSKKF